MSENNFDGAMSEYEKVAVNLIAGRTELSSKEYREIKQIALEMALDTDAELKTCYEQYMESRNKIGGTTTKEQTVRYGKAHKFLSYIGHFWRNIGIHVNRRKQSHGVTDTNNGNGRSTRALVMEWLNNNDFMPSAKSLAFFTDKSSAAFSNGICEARKNGYVIATDANGYTVTERPQREPQSKNKLTELIKTFSDEQSELLLKELQGRGQE